jgi:hypothetical protein
VLQAPAILTGRRRKDGKNVPAFSSMLNGQSGSGENGRQQIAEKRQQGEIADDVEGTQGFHAVED